MAFTAITPQPALSNSNLNPVVYGAANAGGDMFANNGKMTFRVKNGSGAGITVTVSSVPDPYGRSGDQVIALAAGAECEIGHLDPALWNQRTGNVGFVQISYSAVTSVTSACIQHG